MSKTDIKEASDDKPLGVLRPVSFRKYFAEGALARREDNTLRLAFYNEKTPARDEKGELYVAECEIIMTWETAKKIRDLLDFTLKKYDESELSDGTD